MTKLPRSLLNCALAITCWMFSLRVLLGRRISDDDQAIALAKLVHTYFPHLEAGGLSSGGRTVLYATPGSACQAQLDAIAKALARMGAPVRSFGVWPPEEPQSFAVVIDDGFAELWRLALLAAVSKAEIRDLRASFDHCTSEARAFVAYCQLSMRQINHRLAECRTKVGALEKRVQLLSSRLERCETGQWFG